MSGTSKGPAPKPTAMKRAAGNPGKRRLNEREPVPSARLAPAPTWLSKAAKAEYRRVGRQLLALGVVTEIDRTALAVYANSYTRWVEAEEQVQERGTIVKTSNGNPIQNPYLAVANRALDDMRRMLAEFGMTPSSRTRVQTVTTTTTGLEELLAVGDWEGDEAVWDEAMM